MCRVFRSELAVEPKLNSGYVASATAAQQLRCQPNISAGRRRMGTGSGRKDIPHSLSLGSCNKENKKRGKTTRQAVVLSARAVQKTQSSGE